MDEIFETLGGHLRVTPFAFGVYLQGKYTPEELFKLCSEFLPHIKADSISSLPEDKVFEYYWIPIKQLSLDSCKKAVQRCSYSTRVSCFTKEYFKAYLDSNNLNKGWYHLTYNEFFDAEEITRSIRKYVGRLKSLKVLVLGCASGEVMLELALRGLNVRGIEFSPYIIKKAHPMVAPYIDYGDFLVDLDKYKNNEFDVVYTSALCYVNEIDMENVLIDIRRICRTLVINKYYKINNWKTYRNFDTPWWHDKYAKCGLQKTSRLEIILKK